MAVRRDTKYPGRFDNATSTQPQGAFKNRTTAESQDGSYLEKDWLNDWSGFMSSLLSSADIVPNGVVDEVGASQYFDALQKLQVANNLVKTSQFVVVGRTGHDIPEAGVNKNYTTGAEVSLGWFATSNVVNATKDINGNLIADSGVVRYTTQKDENDTVDVMFASVMSYDGSKYTQLYDSELAGLSVGGDATSYWIEVDLASVSGVVFGLSEKKGTLPIDSVRNIELSARGYILTETSNGVAMTWADGRCEQYGITPGATPSVTVTLPIPFSTTSYVVTASDSGNSATASAVCKIETPASTSQFTIYRELVLGSVIGQSMWRAVGVV